MLVAAAAMAFASCQKEETAALETVSVNLTMHAGVEQTRTYLDEGNAVLWGKGEGVTLYVGSGETAKFFNSASTDAYDGKASASFTFAIEGVAVADSYTLGGIYPESAAMDDNKNAAQYKVILPATQNQVDGNYDPSAYIMVLKPEMVDALPTEYTASFRRAIALNKVTLTNVAEDITSVEITVPAEKYLAGRRYFDLTTGDSGEVYYDKSSTISVNSAFTGNSIDVWFCSWGVELAAGEKLTITMKSTTKSYTHTITANENGIKFVEGDLNTLKINMAYATVEDTGDYSGEWLITGTTSDATYAAKAYSTGNNLSSPVQITVAEDGSIDEVDGLDKCKMTFTKMIEGEYEGMYTIQDASGNYLYAASPSANQLKGGASANSAHYYWTVECKEGAYSIIASKSANRNVMQFNPNNGTPLFNCYASASQTAVVLYPYSNVKPDTTPRIIVAEDALTQNVDADATNLSFAYELKNIISGVPTVEVADDATMTIVSATAADGTVTVTFDANEEETPKSATITLSYEGATPVDVVINQAAAAGEDEATEFSVTYKVTSTTSVEVSSGTAPEGSNAAFNNTYTTKEQITSSKSQTYTLSGYEGCVIKSVTLSMKSNSSKGAGTFSLKAGATTLASIESATDFNKWYDNTSFGTSYRDVHVQMTNTEYVIGNENVVLVLNGTTNSIYCQSVTITYSSSVNGGGGNESEEPDVEEPTEPQTYTYTFTSKEWADATNSWTSGKDGNQMQSGRGIQVTTGASGANATCITSMNNVSKAVVVYSTNTSKGAGNIKLSIGGTEIEQSVTTTGGTDDRNLEFDFSSTSPSGTPKITVTCTTNSIYIKSITFTTN